MGSKKQCSTVGHRYYVGLHLIFCHAVDEVLEIVVGDKSAWSGSVTANTSFEINQPQLFGGEDREGGIEGQIDLEFGLPAQGRNSYLQNILGALVPAYRGLFGLVARAPYIAANSPYIKPWSVRARRTATGWQPGLANVEGGMNGAHIIRECLTNTTYGGLGYPEADLDEQSFLNCANVLDGEGFGLNLLWSRDVSIEDFIGNILQHIDGAGFLSHITGLYTLKLIRNDYDIGALTVVNESNIIELEDFAASSVLEGTNQVIVTYEDTEGRETSVTVQDPAGIERMNGEVVPATYQFAGINNQDLAIKVASRELLQLCSPMASCTLKANRTTSHLQPGDPFNFSWDPLGIVDMVMRVREVEVGLHADGAMRIRAVRDVFSADSVSLTQPSSTQWTSPISAPANSSYRRVEELLWWDFVKVFGSSEAVLAELTDQTSFATSFCSRPSSDSIDFEMWDRPAGGSDFTRRDQESFPEITATMEAMIPEVTSVVEISTIPDKYLVNVGDYAYVGTELCAILVIDGTSLTLARGILDTVPVSHAAGTIIYFPSALYCLSEEEYAAGETVEIRMLPSTSAGRLALSSATTNSLLFTGRMMRPYPPGNVKINTLRWPTSLPKSVVAVTFQDAGDTVTKTAHGLNNGEIITFPTIVTTTGITVDTNYYVVGKTDNTFQVSDTLGGVAKALTTNGTGTLSHIPPTTITWAHRSRLLQTVAFNQQDEEDIGPEAGVTYTIRIYGQSGTLRRTVTGLTDPTYTYLLATERTDSSFTAPQLNTSLRIELEAVRGSLTSREKWNLTVTRS